MHARLMSGAFRNAVVLIATLLICLCLAMGLGNRDSTDLERPTTQFPLIEISVISVVPDTVSFTLEGSFIRATRDEMAGFAALGLGDVSHGFHVCVEIKNTSDQSMLLSRHDLWRLLAGNAQFVLDNGSQWGSRLTIRPHPIDPVFDIPVLAKSSRQMLIPIDGAEIAAAAGRLPGQDFEGEFEFKLQRGAALRARSIVNGALHESDQVVVRAVGRGQVSEVVIIP